LNAASGSCFRISRFFSSLSADNVAFGLRNGAERFPEDEVAVGVLQVIAMVGLTGLEERASLRYRVARSSVSR